MIQFVLETDRALFEDAMRFAQQRTRKLVESHPGFYPMYTANGKWKHEGQVWTNWCDGFFPGMMWIFHKMEPRLGRHRQILARASRALHHPARTAPA